MGPVPQKEPPRVPGAGRLPPADHGVGWDSDADGDAGQVPTTPPAELAPMSDLTGCGQSPRRIPRAERALPMPEDGPRRYVGSSDSGCSPQRVRCGCLPPRTGHCTLGR